MGREAWLCSPFPRPLLLQFSFRASSSPATSLLWACRFPRAEGLPTLSALRGLPCPQEPRPHTSSQAQTPPAGPGHGAQCQPGQGGTEEPVRWARAGPSASPSGKEREGAGPLRGWRAVGSDLWMPEHWMQRVTPRLMLAHSGAGSRQSQHCALPSTPCTWATTCPAPPGSLPRAIPPPPSVAEELVAGYPEPWGRQRKTESGHEAWGRVPPLPGPPGPAPSSSRHLAGPPGAVIEASVAEGRGDAALYGADPQLEEALGVSLQEAGPGREQGAGSRAGVGGLRPGEPRGRVGGLTCCSTGTSCPDIRNAS